MTNLSRRIILTTAAAAGLALIGTAASAAGYPSKPITMIIPLGAGGSHDLNARVMTSVLPSYLGQPVIVQLMPGGSGRIGTAAAAKAKPDGYTLLFTHNFIDELQQHVTKLPYNPNKDFVIGARGQQIQDAEAVDRLRQGQSRQSQVRSQRKLGCGHGAGCGAVAGGRREDDAGAV